MAQLRRSKPKQLTSDCLPYDVVFEILTRLPVKSLLQLRCVSKTWNSIITNPDFIKTHFNRAKSLSNNSNNNGYLLYMHHKDLCTIVCNRDHTLSQISRFQIPISHARIVGLCNGMYLCHDDTYTHRIYLWNQSIRKFKSLAIAHLTLTHAALGLAYQNNDFKILRIVCFRGPKQPPPPAEAAVYTLSTDSWRRVVISLVSEPDIGPSDYIVSSSPCLFFNGALHSIAQSGSHKFILSFDVNDETFRRIMLPQNYLDGFVWLSFERLAVFKGLLALFVFCKTLYGNMEICHIWVMREYGVVASWTKKSIPVHLVRGFFCCTDSGELLIDSFDRGVISYDPESQNENNLGIQKSPSWLTYTADLMESLVLLDQVIFHLNMKISLYTKINLLKFLAK